MKVSPTQKNERKLNTVIVLFFLLGVAVYALPMFFGNALSVAPFCFAAIGIVFFVTALFLILRYKMTRFEYVIRLRDDTLGTAIPASDGSPMPEDLDFVVYKGQGTAPAAMECVLSLEDFIAAYRLGKGKASQKELTALYQKDGFTFYNYTLTFRPAETVEIVFRDNERYVGIIIESDNDIADYFLKRNEI